MARGLDDYVVSLAVASGLDESVRAAVLCLFGSSGGAWAVGCPVTAGLLPHRFLLLAAVVPLRGSRPQLAYACLGCAALPALWFDCQPAPERFPRPLRAARTRRKDPAH